MLSQDLPTPEIVDNYLLYTGIHSYAVLYWFFSIVNESKIYNRLFYSISFFLDNQRIHDLEGEANKLEIKASKKGLEGLLIDLAKNIENSYENFDINSKKQKQRHNKKQKHHIPNYYENNLYYGLIRVLDILSSLTIDKGYNNVVSLEEAKEKILEQNISDKLKEILNFYFPIIERIGIPELATNLKSSSLDLFLSSNLQGIPKYVAKRIKYLVKTARETYKTAYHRLS